MSNLHNVDTVRRTGSNTDELTTHSVTSTSELVSLNRCQDEALDAAHSHTQSQELKRKGFACATGADKVEIRIFVLLGIEEIHDTQRVIMTVDAEQDTRIIRKLIARKHIGRSRATGQHVSLCLLFKRWRNLQKRHYRTKCRFLLELAIAHVHIHRLEHIYHLLLAPHQFLIGLGRHGNKDRHIKQIFVVVSDAVFDVIAGLNRVCQFLIVGTGILHTLYFSAVESDTLSNLINGLASVLSSQVNVNIHAFTGIDQRRHPTGSYTARITITLDIKECVIETVHNHIVVMLQVNASGSNEVSKADMWHFINTDNLILRCHRIHDNTLHTA